VRALWDANAAVFVDARTAAEYREERIARAVSLPLDDLGQRPELVTSFSSGGKPVVVYCGGGECELSKNLAWNLVDAGHKKVLVYLGGIAEWKERGAPVTKGEPGGSR
jgi:rhodanese-related sulfurtransferase